MTKLYNALLLVVIPTITLLLNGCSTGYFDPAYKYPASAKVPEISKQNESIPKYSSSTSEAAETPIYSPEVSTYNGDSISSIDTIFSDEEKIADAQTKAIVDIDPYDSIPSTSKVITSTITSRSTNPKSSPAVQSLIVSAQSDLAVGKNGSAVSKLERGLRIESQNPKLWYLLAQAKYEQSNYQQAISMSKKAIRFSSDDDFIASNWNQIKKAGLKSGDTIAVKEAISYFKVNP